MSMVFYEIERLTKDGVDRIPDTLVRDKRLSFVNGEEEFSEFMNTNVRSLHSITSLFILGVCLKSIKN